MKYGIDIERLSHGANIPDLFPSVSHATMSDEFQRTGQAMFIQCPRKVRRNHRFVNLVCDTGTVVHFKIIHVALSHPSRFSKVTPFEPYENHDWNADQYESLFEKIVTALLPNDGNRPLEVCGSICDNILAQVAGLLHFINDKDGSRA
jgi:hypothetical protein